MNFALNFTSAKQSLQFLALSLARRDATEPGQGACKKKYDATVNPKEVQAEHSR